MLSNLVDTWLNKCPLFEQHCLLCGQRPAPEGLCHACIRSLPRDTSVPRCPQCNLPAGSPQVPCGRCLQHPPAFHRLYSAYDYAYPLDGLITRCKYGPAMGLQGALANRMTDGLRRQPDVSLPDWLVPVPLAPAKLAERGFNLPDALARSLAATMQRPCVTDLCWRRRNTAPQASLDRAARRANVRDAFGVKHRCDGLSIALVDDVASTGATLDALAKTLLSAGAKRVDAWVLARAPIRHT